MDTQKSLQVLHFIKKSRDRETEGMNIISNSYIFWVICITIVYFLLSLLFIKLKRVENIAITDLFYSYSFLLLMSEWFFLYFKINLKQPVLESSSLQPSRLISQLICDYVYDIKLITFILPLPFFIYSASGAKVLWALLTALVLVAYYLILQLLLIIILLIFTKYPKLDNIKHLVWPILIVTFSLGTINQSYHYYNIFPPVYLVAHAISSCINYNYLNTIILLIISSLIYFGLWAVGIPLTKGLQSINKTGNASL